MAGHSEAVLDWKEPKKRYQGALWRVPGIRPGRNSQLHSPSLPIVQLPTVPSQGLTKHSVRFNPATVTEQTLDCPVKRPAPCPENLRHDPEHQRKARESQGLTAYRQAVDWQRKLVKAADDPDISPANLAKLSRAWWEQEQIKRAIRGLGPPKSIPASNDPTLKRQRRQSPSGPVESLGPA